MSNFLKIHPWDSSCSRRSDRQTIGRRNGHDKAYSRCLECCEHV